MINFQRYIICRGQKCAPGQDDALSTYTISNINMLLNAGSESSHANDVAFKMFP